MKTELILKSDVLDIIFENRNKAYGAYYLRKFYSSRLAKSLLLMITGVGVLSAFTLLPGKGAKTGREEILTTAPVVIQEIKDKKEEPEKPKEQPPKKQEVATVQLTDKIAIVPNDANVKPLEAITDSTNIGLVTQKGDSGAVAVVGSPVDLPVEGGGGKDPGPAAQVDAVTPTASPDVMPEYPGGMEALRKFLQRHLTNPRDMEEGELVSVKVRFVVGYDGKLKSFETVEDGGEEFNKEVIRVLKKMPEWLPGKTRGQNVSVYYTIPVKFVPGN